MVQFFLSMAMTTLHRTHTSQAIRSFESERTKSSRDSSADRIPPTLIPPSQPFLSSFQSSPFPLPYSGSLYRSTMFENPFFDGFGSSVCEEERKGRRGVTQAELGWALDFALSQALEFRSLFFRRRSAKLAGWSDHRPKFISSCRNVWSAIESSPRLPRVRCSESLSSKCLFLTISTLHPHERISVTRDES